MRVVNLHAAKTHLSRLGDQAAGGEEIVGARPGKPLAKLVPFTKPKPRRQPGFLKGRIKIAADFDAPLPADLLDAFEARR